MGRRGEQTQSEVLAVLRGRQGPASAYDILDALRATNPKVAPPTVYRALAALIERKCVHRLESLNAYIACRHQAHADASILSICDDCGAVEEAVAPDVLKALSSVTGEAGFVPARHVIEIHGVCASCDGSVEP